MDRVDREIAKVEQQILKLKKKQVSTANTALLFSASERGVEKLHLVVVNFLVTRTR